MTLGITGNVTYSFSKTSRISVINIEIAIFISQEDRAADLKDIDLSARGSRARQQR
jgi:hypothetical protein